MDVEKIARKLEPLMPKEVQHLLKARDFADSELKSLIDRQILHLAHEKLGDFRSKFLPSLPPAHKARGSFHLGTVQYEQDKWPFGLSASELLQNLAIFGRSGAGKTNVAFHLLEQLTEKNVPWLFLDWKRTGRHLLPRLKKKVNIYTPGRSLSRFPFNPFIVPPGLEANVYINHVVDLLADAYTLGDGARSLLQKAIASCYSQGNDAPSVEEIQSLIEAVPDKERVKGWKISTIRALESLAYSDILAKDRITQEQLVKTLLEGHTIIELDGLSHGSKKFLIPLLCTWIYYVKLAGMEREKLSLMIFVEEAHHVLYRQEKRYKESVMNMLLRQCRELGIGMVVVDQHCHLISAAALGNTYTTICLNQKDPTDMNRAAALSLIGADDKKHFSMLPVGHGIVKMQDRWRKPFLVKFPLVHIKKGLITDGILKRVLHGDLTHSRLRKLVEAESSGFPRIPHADIVLNDHSLALIEDVLTLPNDGVLVRYQRLGWGSKKGNRIKKELVRSGILDSQEVEIGRTRKLLLRVSSSAKLKLGLNSDHAQRGSLAHEYWKRFYADLYRKKGYLIELEAPRPGRPGRVDVLGRKRGNPGESDETVAIEIETGKSDVVWNVKQDLAAGFDRVLVVATDNNALEKVERQLVRVGLIIPNRVILKLKTG